MRPEEYSERRMDIHGWQVNLTTYRLAGEYHCKADNVSPGAWLARTSGATREEAEGKAVQRATEMLARTRRQAV